VSDDDTVPSIRIENLRKSFGAEEVLRGIDLTVEQGEFFVLIGASGSGKSTVLKSIAGLVEPDDGRILVDGEDVSRTPVNERDVGFVFQEFDETLFPHMTVAENVQFGLQQSDREYTSAEIDERVTDMLDLLAISETRDDLPTELSGGQQQRVELARQLVRGCEIMLFDDPLADLDYKLQKRMELELRRFHADTGGTYLYVTHNQDQALTLADKIALIHDGRIEQVGSPSEIYDHPNNAYVGRFVGDSTLLEAQITEMHEGGTVLAETPLGEVLARPGNDGLEVGSEGVILVRPEDIAFGEDARGLDNQFTGQPQNRTYTGEMTEFIFSVDGSESETEIQVIYPGNVAADLTESLPIGFDPASAIFFSQLSSAGDTSVAALKRL
jgi:ABC-type Fe3+/spermidine/putrescine transport system ATPase subunit